MKAALGPNNRQLSMFSLITDDAHEQFVIFLVKTWGHHDSINIMLFRINRCLSSIMLHFVVKVVFSSVKLHPFGV